MGKVAAGTGGRCPPPLTGSDVVRHAVWNAFQLRSLLQSVVGPSLRAERRVADLIIPRGSVKVRYGTLL